jgi:prepilin-type processing-associated H-X9-DG protein/prepilin-type N-terminal cleavage/methylation domain-containing protein
MKQHRIVPAFTLLELIIVIAIIGLLLALSLPAVHRVRESAARARCGNNMKQLGLGLHMYHDSWRSLPPGVSYLDGRDPHPFMSWQARLLPYLEQQALWASAIQAYAQDKDFRNDPPHVAIATVLPAFICPSDSRSRQVARVGNQDFAFTDYLGVEGVNSGRMDGVLYLDSKTRFADIADGTSYTLAVGERPPSADFVLGWWYAGQGQGSEGSADSVLGVRETCYYGLANCPRGPYEFGPGRSDNICDAFHFWSHHPGGANFLFADGSARFLPYSARPIMPALATRAGGETVSLPD